MRGPCPRMCARIDMEAIDEQSKAPAEPSEGSGSSFAAELQELLRRVQIDPAQVDAVLEQLKTMAQTTYKNELQQISLARLRVLIDAGRAENALALAKRLLPILLGNNQEQAASLAYRCLGKSRQALELDPDLHRKLAKALRATSHFRDAAWNYFKAVETDGKPEEGHDACLNLAQEAEKAEKPLEAMAIYRFVLKQYPESNMRDFVISSLEFQELKIRRQQEEAEEAAELARAKAAKNAAEEMYTI